MGGSNAKTAVTWAGGAVNTLGFLVKPRKATLPTCWVTDLPEEDSTELP